MKGIGGMGFNLMMMLGGKCDGENDEGREWNVLEAEKKNQSRMGKG